MFITYFCEEYFLTMESKTKENHHAPSASQRHTCGHGLIGRDAGHGDSVGRGLVGEARAEGSLRKTQ